MRFCDKASARAYFSSLRASLTEEQRLEKSEKICKKILDIKEFSECDTLLLYYPIKSEPSALPLLTEAFARGMSVAFPISIKDDFTLDFREIKSLDELSVGAYGICEPKNDASFAEMTEKTICIVPALSFDKSFHRLGYGKGFYDRFLKNFKGTAIGITYSELICEKLPADDNDIPVNYIITD